MINLGIQIIQCGMLLPITSENNLIVKQSIFNIRNQIHNIEMKINNNSMPMKNNIEMKINNNSIPMNNNAVKDSRTFTIDFAKANGEHDFIEMSYEETIDQALKNYLIKIKRP